MTIKAPLPKVCLNRNFDDNVNLKGKPNTSVID